MRAALLLAALALCARAADPEPDDPAKKKVREVTKVSFRLSSKFGGEPAPVKIASAEELAKNVPDKEAQAALKKEVDFSKEYLLVFTWAGSGGDRLDHKVEKTKGGAEVVFNRIHGDTNDLRRHQQVYAVPKKLTYRLAK